MQNFPDNEFDAWIKKTLEEPQLAFDPEAWRKMEHRLDNYPYKWLNNFFNGLSLTVAIMILLYISILNDVPGNARVIVENSHVNTNLKPDNVQHEAAEGKEVVSLFGENMDNTTETNSNSSTWQHINSMTSPKVESLQLSDDINPSGNFPTNIEKKDKSILGFKQPDNFEELEDNLNTLKMSKDASLQENTLNHPYLNEKPTSEVENTSTELPDTHKGINLSGKEINGRDHESSDYLIRGDSKKTIVNSQKWDASNWEIDQRSKPSGTNANAVKKERESLSYVDLLDGERGVSSKNYPNQATSDTDFPLAPTTANPDHIDTEKQDNEYNQSLSRNGNDEEIIHLSQSLSYVAPKPFIFEDTGRNGLQVSMESMRVAESTADFFRGRTYPRLNIGIFFSPDLSSVKFLRYNAAGLNSGITIEYYLSENWRISLGGGKSNKIYDVDNRRNSGYGSSTPQGGPESIDAVCSVLDIPLNVRYNFNTDPKGHWFISAGLSSYLMLKEDYRFNYRRQNTIVTEELSLKGANNHFFQILNISFGYEKSLGKNFAVQAEPFVKLPVKEIGYGKVRLITTGAFISLKYKLY